MLFILNLKIIPWCQTLSKALEIKTLLTSNSLSSICNFFPMDFLSQTFTIHRKKREGRCYFLNSSLPFPPTSQTIRHLDISRVITEESSLLHIASIRTRTGNLWFPRANRLPWVIGNNWFIQDSPCLIRIAFE